MSANPAVSEARPSTSGRRVTNVHERVVAASADDVAALLETLGSRDDAMWRTRVPGTMTLDAGLAVGSAGGHADVRYHVAEHVPGRRVVLAFDEPFQIVGEHRFEVEPLTPGSTMLRHTLEGRLRGAMRWQWPLVVRPAHDTVVEDIHDHVERTLTGTAHRRQRPSRRIGLAVALLPARDVASRTPPTDGLLAAALERVDASDTWATPVLPGDPRDAATWNRILFASSPRWVDGLMRLRDAVVRPFGLRTTGDDPDAGGFPRIAATDDEVLTGVDDRHLSFRVSTRVVDDEVMVTTVVQIHNRLGRAYWSVVRWFHPRVVRAILGRTPRPAGGVRGPGRSPGQADPPAGVNTSTGRDRP